MADEMPQGARLMRVEVYTNHIRIPTEYLTKAGIRRGEQVKVSIDNDNRIIIEKRK